MIRTPIGKFPKSVNWGLATEHKYIVDITGELPVILMDLNLTDSSLKKKYIYVTDPLGGVDPLGADRQIIAQHACPLGDGEMSDDKYFYLHDRLGSVRLVIDDQSAVKNTYTYEPFGEMLATECTETIENPFKFTGQYFDSEIEEYYLRARQYNPHLARFTSRDPAMGEFDEPITLHKYLYCGNDPVNWIDPSGEFLSGASLAEPIVAGYSVHYLAIGYAAYGVATGRDAFLALGIQMEMMIQPVIALAMGKTVFPQEDPRMNRILGRMSELNKANYTCDFRFFKKLPGGKWGAVGTFLALFTYHYRNEIAELFTPEPWKELLGIDDDDSAIRAPDTR